MAAWGKEQITLGKVEDWKQASVRCTFKDPVKNANLFMDSSDFRLKGKCNTSRKDSKWSFKCNSPDQRYMFLQDSRTVIKKIWGGYSPKVYDGDFLSINQNWIEENLNEAEILADFHFKNGEKLFKNVKFHVPTPNPSRGITGDSSGLSTLTKEQRRRNKNIRAARSRVEILFVY